VSEYSGSELEVAVWLLQQLASRGDQSQLRALLDREAGVFREAISQANRSYMVEKCLGWWHRLTQCNSGNVRDPATRQFGYTPSRMPFKPTHA